MSNKKNNSKEPATDSKKARPIGSRENFNRYFENSEGQHVKQAKKKPVRYVKPTGKHEKPRVLPRAEHVMPQSRSRELIYTEALIRQRQAEIRYKEKIEDRAYDPKSRYLAEDVYSAFPPGDKREALNHPLPENPIPEKYLNPNFSPEKKTEEEPKPDICEIDMPEDRVEEEETEKREISKNSGFKIFFSKFLFFPLTFAYLEIVFHLYMGLGLKFLPIYLFFSISFGLLASILTNYFSKTVNQILSIVITAGISFIYVVEMLCRVILSSFYQVSSLKTASHNHLSDYSGAILKGIKQTDTGIILLFVPLFILLFFGSYLISYKKKNKKGIASVFLLALITYVLGYSALFLPYKSYYLPHDLYDSDTNIEAQVNELGVVNMLRLDLKHMIFGVRPPKKLTEKQIRKIDNITNTKEKNNVNALNIDFDNIKQNSKKSKEVMWLNSYFNAVNPTNKNKYTGAFKGYNVIFITAEGFSGYMIDKNLTPTLYKLSHEGINFKNFYTPLHYTSTTNGECQNLLGLYPKNGDPKTLEYVGENGISMPFTLANELNKKGYYSAGYHLNRDMYARRKSMPCLGYEWHDMDDLNPEKKKSGKNIFPQSDKYMVEQTFNYFSSSTPFNAYYLTISGHMPYSVNSNAMAEKNAKKVENLKYSENTKNYISANLELEDALTDIVKRLEENNIADKTLLVMVPDHIPYFDIDVLEELSGKDLTNSKNNNFINEETIDPKIYKNTAIIWSKGMEENISVNKVCSQVDILPTLLNMLGIDYDSRLLAGTDVFSDSKGIAVLSSGNWISDDGYYNVYTQKFKKSPFSKLQSKNLKNYLDSMNLLSQCRLRETAYIQDTNYFSLIK